tara:strand:- start:760 stop:1635 length:876 start_codon:yes stop_codon:yes gene_type:complete
MRVLITGSSGMLGSTLAKLWRGKFEIYGTSRKKINTSPKNFLKFNFLDDDYSTLLKWSEPDVIVHCAAITNLDYCEDNEINTIKVNGESVKELIEHSAGSKIIFISSDAVFPDNIFQASENDKINPQNIYGKSKKIGEEYVSSLTDNGISIRTTIVGKNINTKYQSFLEWIVNSLKKFEEIKLFTDSLFSPITIWHLAAELEWIIKNDISGLFHISGNEPISKYDFGIMVGHKLGLDTSLIKKSKLKDYQFSALRNKDQSLDSSRYQKAFNRTLPSLDETINEINHQYKNL